MTGEPPSMEYDDWISKVPGSKAPNTETADPVKECGLRNKESGNSKVAHTCECKHYVGTRRTRECERAHVVVPLGDVPGVRYPALSAVLEIRIRIIKGRNVRRLARDQLRESR